MAGSDPAIHWIRQPDCCLISNDNRFPPTPYIIYCVSWLCPLEYGSLGGTDAFHDPSLSPLSRKVPSDLSFGDFRIEVDQLEESSDCTTSC